LEQRIDIDKDQPERQGLMQSLSEIGSTWHVPRNLGIAERVMMADPFVATLEAQADSTKSTAANK